LAAGRELKVARHVAPEDARMIDDIAAVEFVAKAFYDLQEGARGWDREPERLKEPFRQYARDAIALLDPAGGRKPSSLYASSE
jgi:hypothetical protein